MQEQAQEQLKDKVKQLIQDSIRLEKEYCIPEAFHLISKARRDIPSSRVLAIRQAQLLERLKQYDNALALYKGLADGQENSVEPPVAVGMARAMLALKQYAQAEDLFRKLKGQLTRDPDIPTGLAQIELERGNVPAARALVQEALAIAPDHRWAQHELGAVQRAAGELNEAIATLEANALREDHYGDSLDLWLDILREQKRERYIQEKLEEAAAKFPNKVEFIFGLGVQAHRAGEVAQARAAIARAAQLSQDNHRILHEWGVLERMAGDIQKSQELLARSLELNPEQPGTLRVFGTEHKFAYGDKEFTRLNYAAAKLADVELIDQVHLHYALGKAFEDVNELDTAFRHYEMAGAKKKKLEPLDEKASAMIFQIMPGVVNKETAKLHHEKGYESDVPVFILGMPRSGTSLIEQILSSHPDIYGAGELKLLPPVVDNMRFGNNRLQMNDPEPAFPYDAEAGWEARGRWYVEHLQKLADKPYKRIVDKMPGNFTLAGLIKPILPNARIIHSRRHPVETCLSNYRIHFAEGQLWSYNLRELGRYYRRYWQLMKHWRENFPGMMYEIRYEDNVADVEGQARKLIDFLGLPWHEGVLEFYNTDRPVKTASASQVRKPIYKSSTNRWRKYEKYLAPLLDELGDIVPEYEAEIAHLNRES